MVTFLLLSIFQTNIHVKATTIVHYEYLKIHESELTLSNFSFSVPPATEWSKTYGEAYWDEAYSVIQTNGGGYALTGYKESSRCYPYFWLVKADSAGNMQWNRTYGEGRALSMVQTFNGGYALAGVGMGGFCLVKTDSDGNMQWNKTYGGRGANSIVQTSDEGYALAGSTYSDATKDDFLLVKTDSSGNVQWTQTYGEWQWDEANSMIQTNDGGYALAGETWSRYVGGGNSWLVKTDSAGNMIWNKTYEGMNVVSSLVQTNDGGYALAGPKGTWPDMDFCLVKTDSDGNMQWNKTYGGTGSDAVSSLIQTSDGGYALAGDTNSFDAGWYYDFWLVKTDSDGNMQWNKTYGGGDHDYAYSMIQTSDGGYALAGSTWSFGAGTFDFWLVKLAPSTPHAQPRIVSATFDNTVVDYGDWVTITVKARNGGERADEMYISVSLPDNPPIENIQMVSHDLQEAYILPVGAEVWGDYGTTYPIVLGYPLVEGFKENWETGEIKTLQFKVKPTSVGIFRFFVKTTAKVNGEWSYDPQSGPRDQQNEYVGVYTVSVRSPLIETALDLETPPSRVLAYHTVVFTGQLTREDDGSGITDALIKIYEKDLLSEEILAEGRTNQQGKFSISWFATPMDLGPLPSPVDKTIEIQAKFEGSSELTASASNVHEMTIEPIDVYTDRGGQGLDEADGFYTRSDVVRLIVARYDFDVSYPDPLRQYSIEVFDPSGTRIFWQKLDGEDEFSIDGWVGVETDFPLSQEMPLGIYRVEVEYVLVASGNWKPPKGSIYQIGKDVTSFTVTERFEVDVKGEKFTIDLITNSEIVSVQPLVDSTRTILKLSGSDGTTGWLNLAVNKSMVTSLGGNKDTIRVLIDGNPSNFTVTEISEDYVISVSYFHSVRVIEIVYTTAFYPTTLIVIAFVVVVVAVSFTAYFIRSKQLRRKSTS